MELIEEARGRGLGLMKTLGAGAAMGLGSLLGGQAAAEEPKKPEVTAPAPAPKPGEETPKPEAEEIDLSTVYSHPAVAKMAETQIKYYANKYMHIFNSAGVDISPEDVKKIENVVRKVLKSYESKDKGSTLGGEEPSTEKFKAFIDKMTRMAYGKIHGSKYKKAKEEKKAGDEGEVRTKVSTYEGPASERPKRSKEETDRLIRMTKKIKNEASRRAAARSRGLNWEDVMD
jgi:hypothetical protein